MGYPFGNVAGPFAGEWDIVCRVSPAVLFYIVLVVVGYYVDSWVDLVLLEDVDVVPFFEERSLGGLVFLSHSQECAYREYCCNEYFFHLWYVLLVGCLLEHCAESEAEVVCEPATLFER